MEELTILIWLLIGVGGWFIAFRNRKNFLLWLIICALLGVVGLILALMFYKPEKKKEPEKLETNPVESKLKYLQMKEDYEKSKSK
jgi:hypothetical protein